MDLKFILVTTGSNFILKTLQYSKLFSLHPNQLCLEDCKNKVFDIYK